MLIVSVSVSVSNSGYVITILNEESEISSPKIMAVPSPSWPPRNVCSIRFLFELSMFQFMAIFLGLELSFICS